MNQVAFFVMQAIFWSVAIVGWMRVARLNTTPLRPREWIARASLACGSLTLLFTAAMTVYVRVSKQKPYDVWESRYLLWTAAFSLLDITLAFFGKAAPRLAGLSISLFTLLIALADAVSL